MQCRRWRQGGWVLACLLVQAALVLSVFAPVRALAMYDVPQAAPMHHAHHDMIMTECGKTQTACADPKIQVRHHSATEACCLTGTCVLSPLPERVGPKWVVPRLAALARYGVFHTVSRDGRTPAPDSPPPRFLV